MRKEIKIYSERKIKKVEIADYIHFDASAKETAQFGTFKVIKNDKLLYNIRIEQNSEINSFRNLYIGPIRMADKIEFITSNDHDFDIWYSTDRQISVNQADYIKSKFKVESLNGIKYNAIGSETPKKLAIIFPGYGAQNRVEYPIDQLNSLKDQMIEKDIRSIALYDDHYIEGSWMLYNKDKSIVADVCKTINDLKIKYNCTNDQLHFYGLSKGGASAYYFAQFFEGIKVAGFCPAMIVEDMFWTNPRYSLITQAAKAYGVDIKTPDIPAALRKIAYTNDVKYFYGENDHFFENGTSNFIKENNLPIYVEQFPDTGHGGAISVNKFKDTMLNWW